MQILQQILQNTGANTSTNTEADIADRHWQESRSREILEEKWLRFFSLAREKLIFMSRSPLDFQESEKQFLFLLSIFKIWKKILFLLSIFKIF